MARKKKIEIFDKKDEAIIHCIQQDPSILLKRIPDAIEKRGGASIPYPTVQRRVNELIKSGIVDRRYYINWAEAGYLVRYRVGILIDPVALQAKSEEPENKEPESKEYYTQDGLADHILHKLAQSDTFKNKLVVDDVHILLGGRVDLSIDFYAKDDKTATQFIIEALRKLPGVSNTSSAKLAYSAKDGWLSKNGSE
jgi:DNA-binding Lrp family transcriptional regulator